MSKSLKLTVAAGLLITVVLTIVWDGQRSDPELQTNELVFPNLLDRLNDVTEIFIVTAEESYRIAVSANQWTVPEVFGYPADLNKVRATLIGLAQARLVELVNEDSKSLEKFGLSNSTSPEFKGAQITIKQNDHSVAEILIGDRRQMSTNQSNTQYYARYPDQFKIWAIDTILPEFGTSSSWLDRRLGRIAKDRIKQTSITPIDSPQISVSRQSPLEEFLLDSPNQPQSQYILNDIGEVLNKLMFESVFPTPIDALWGVHFQSITFDGLVIEGRLSHGGQNQFVELFANALDKSSQSLRMEAEELNRLWRGWSYQLSDSRLKILNLTLEDLMTDT